MKQLFLLSGMTIFLLYAESSFSQSSFHFYTPDTIVYDAPKALGDTSCEGDYILNKTANALTIDVVRVQDVDIANSGWTSAFCLDICYADFVDSVRYTIPPSDTVNFIPHFYYTATPDSQSIYMKIKDVANPSNVAYQRFYGVTKIGLGIHEQANLAKVNIYPSPLFSGHDLSMNISNIKIQSKEISLVIYNIYGSKTSTLSGLKEGNNTLNLDLPAGIYSYSLISGGVILNSGKMCVSK